LILFTSDLDRTLIFSQKMMNLYPTNHKTIPVEYKDDEMIAYMSLASVELLKEFNRNHLFVPVTTRALYQYERIDVFQHAVMPKFAIVNNGGTILIDGKADEAWDEHIRKILQDTSSPEEDMLKLFTNIRHETWVERECNVDQFFYMFLINREHVPYTELHLFESELHQIGWRIFLQGRKLYILPNNLNKAFAVSQLQNYLDYEVHVAAGDSIMDYDMLLQADYGFSPTHGDLFEIRGDDSNIKWLNRKGTGSTEELLQELLRLSITVTGIDKQHKNEALVLR
jgi:hydroxymethylpyrimidine pyrophosphatase-like HAD family hydrolase